MQGGNQTLASKFLIVGFSDLPHLQVPLFGAFLLIYIMTLLGNLLIMVIVIFNTPLHTPMYFFLANLSFIDIIYTTNIFPNMLAKFFQESICISLTECLVQMYAFLTMVTAEFSLLAVMAYDRYVAICNPFQYVVIMSKASCSQMAAATWVLALFAPIPHMVLISRLSFCSSHAINHFFCDPTALMKLSCSSTRIIEALTYIAAATLGFAPCFLIISSYVNIIRSVLNIQPTAGRRKAFSTCASHLTVVILFYGVICSTYMRPPSGHATENNKILSLLYIAINPLCNPIIYSLKNTEFKQAIRLKKNNK